MSGSFLLDWATLAVSLFNAILLLWLGLTVLLNAAPYTWGIWLSGAGLLTGAAFFFIHSVILGLGFAYVYWPSDFWWYSGWIPVILAPFAWYVVMLWYTGFWEGQRNPVHQRHRFWFWLLLAIVIVMIGMFLFANPLPTFGQMAHLNLGASLSVFGVPAMILLYPPFIVACIVLSIDALLRPGPTMRAMGQLARRRARPWLASASGLLLLVSLLVAGFAAWLVLSGKEYTPSLELAFAVGWLDLAISTLIAVSILLTGQAIISYEVFTGKALPRRGLSRLWYWTIALAAGYSTLVGFAVSSRFPAVYIAALSTGLLVALLALLSRRSYAEREEFIATLRPFITSQQLYDQLFGSRIESDVRPAEGPFRALCSRVLGTRWAYLAPVGPLAPLFGPPLSYPEPDVTPPIQAGQLLGNISHQTLYLPLELSQNENPGWAIPLWNARGLCGVLLLGEKQDNGLYSQEEMETARTAGERLMDMQASAEISHRLMSLQRRQLAENQVLDRQVRRALHDDILPRLHAILLDLSGTSLAAHSPETLDALSLIHRQIADLLHDLPAAGAPQVQRLGLIGALQQTVENEFSSAFDQVSWEVNPEIGQKLSSLPPMHGEVLYFAAREAIRNAARHARTDVSDIPLELCVSAIWRDGLELTIQDNGVGIENHSTGSESGGSGLALHSTLMAVIGGALEVTSESRKFTQVKLWLPAWEGGSSDFRP